MTTILLVILIIVLGVAVAILYVQLRRAQRSPRRHAVQLPPQPPKPTGPPLLFEVQQYDEALDADRWIQRDDNTWVRRVDAQWVLVDTCNDAEAAAGRLAELVNSAGDPMRYRIVAKVATARNSGITAISDSVMRAAPEPQRKDPTVTQPPPPAPADPDAPSLYQQIGGEGILTEVIKGFYRRVQADPRVQHRFAGIDMNRLVLHQARAFTILTGGPNPKGMTIRELRTWVRDAHRQLGITNAEFTILSAHLVDELNAAGAQQFIPPLADAFESFRGEVVRGEVAA